MMGIGSSSSGSATISSSELVVVYEGGREVSSGDSVSAFTLLKIGLLLLDWTCWLTSEAVEAMLEKLENDECDNED